MLDNEYSVDVRNLTKKYSIKKSLLSYFIKDNDNVISAVNDVSFRVKRGEAFGIIGRNGAGKSTILQIITGTLEASNGECTVNGRVSALLELGSGFNPDFTGRENIYLAGSILGISKKEMDSRFSEIESFAEIGSFIDQPARTYSTGMLMRVAFSVAVAVEPDILIIDEALSVGDILFQQKCNVRLRELLDRGVTLLVVTHDTSFVVNICSRALWLDRGIVKYLGDAGECVKAYVTHMTAISSLSKKSYSTDKPKQQYVMPDIAPLDISACRLLGNGGVYIENVWLLNEQSLGTPIFHIGEWCIVVLSLKSRHLVEAVSGGCELRDRHGQVIFATGLRVINKLIDQIKPEDKAIVRIRFKLDLAPGQYTLDVGCGAGDNNSNVWQRVIAASIIEITSEPSDEVVHGIAKLPYEIQIYKNLISDSYS